MEDNNTVMMKGEMSRNLLTPGMTHEVVPGRAAVVHEDCQVRDIARYADKPYRGAGMVELLMLPTFVDYVLSRNVAGLVFVDKSKAQAVFNADSWGDDVAHFRCECTPDWVAWRGKDKCWMSQEVFCDFLEDQEKVIQEPCGVELLDLVANFRQKSSVEFSRSYRGADGQTCVSYQEKTTGANRDMALPKEFVLHLPVIKGAEQMTTYEVRARLKVRIDKEEKALRLCYELIRPDVPEDNAVRDVADYLREKLPGCDVYEGAVRKSPYDVLCAR